MKTLISTILVAALLGVGLGATLAYVEVPPAANQRSSEPSPPTTTATAPKAFPKAEMPETVFEFGKIEQGASMSHEFKIRNVGERPLRVDVASTTCKCTVGDMAENEIAPGEETDVLLEWVAKTGPGPFRHGAVLSTNDPTQSSIELTVEGQVVESTAMSPSDLVFGTVRAGETPTASLHLMSFLEQDVEVLDYELSDEAVAKHLKIEFTPAQQSELPSPDAVSGVKVAATFESGKTLGPFRTWLTMTTNLEKVEKISVPIVGNVVGDISIFGPGWTAHKGLLRLGSFLSREGKRVTMKVAVRGDHGEDLQLEVAEIDPPQLKATFGEPRQMGDKLLHVPLVIEVPAGSPPIVRLGEPVSSDAHILLRSKNGEVPDFRLRVQFAAE